jgi:hypothetical protein
MIFEITKDIIACTCGLFVVAVTGIYLTKRNFMTEKTLNQITKMLE